MENVFLMENGELKMSLEAPAHSPLSTLHSKNPPACFHTGGFH
jgi:hypothetical protein